MKNVLKFIKKHDNIIVFLILAIIISGKTFYVELLNNDELINFLNVYKMANGLTIYQDTNVIITPLFFYISEIFFKLFGENILVFRIINLILSTILYFICYNIFKALKINKKFSFIYTLIITICTYTIALGGANYNFLSYIFFEIGLLSMICTKNKKTNEIIQGIILFLIFFSNQKLGVGYFLALFIYGILDKNVKALIKEYLIAGTLLIIYLIYLYLQNNLYNFINYTVLGIKEFNDKNWVAGLHIIMYLIVVLAINTFLTVFLIKYLKNKKDNVKENTKRINTIKTLTIFGTCAIILIIPIINQYHTILASILILVNLFYQINYLIYPVIDQKIIYKIINITGIIFSIIILFSNVQSFRKYITEINKISKDSPLYGAIIKDELKEEILNVTNYIKRSNKDTIVISTYAPFYSLLLNDLNNGVYDWPLKGNLGKEGEIGLVEKVKKLENTQILLSNEESIEEEIYQFAYEVTKYIKENMEYIGKIEKFDIYQTK